MAALTILQNNGSLNPSGSARMDLNPGDRVIVRRIGDPTIVVAAAADAFARPRLRFFRKTAEPIQFVTRGAVDSGASGSLTANANPYVVEMDLEQNFEIICPEYASVEVYYPGLATTFRSAYQFAVLAAPATEYHQTVSVRTGPRDYVLSERIASGASIVRPYLSPSFEVMADTAGGPVTATWNFGGGLSDGPWAVAVNTPIYWHGANSIDLRNGAGSPIHITHKIRY